MRGASRYDSTVRNAGGNIVQFLYGEDGMDGTQIEGQKVTLHTLDDSKFRVRSSVSAGTAAGEGALAIGSMSLCCGAPVSAAGSAAMPALTGWTLT